MGILWNFSNKTHFEIFPIKTSGRTNFAVLLSTFGSRNCLHRALMKQNKRFQEKMKLKVIFQRSLSDDLSTSWKPWSLNLITLTSSELWKYCLSGKKRLSFSNLRESRFSRILENFFSYFTSRSRSRSFSISLSLLEKSEIKNQFTFHFSKRVKRKMISLFISRKKWKQFKFHSFFSRKKSEITKVQLCIFAEFWCKTLKIQQI